MQILLWQSTSLRKIGSLIVPPQVLVALSSTRKFILDFWIFFNIIIRIIVDIIIIVTIFVIQSSSVIFIIVISITPVIIIILGNLLCQLVADVFNTIFRLFR